jgi:hypothetical protein
MNPSCPLVSGDGASQHGMPVKPTAQATHARARQAACNLTAAPPLSTNDSVVPPAPPHAVETCQQAALRSNRSVQQDCSTESEECHYLPSEADSGCYKAKAIKGNAVRCGAEVVNADAVQTSAKPSTSARSAVSGTWRHQSTWHATSTPTVNATSQNCAPPSTHIGTPAPILLATPSTLLDPTVWPFLTNPSEVQHTALMTDIAAAEEHEHNKDGSSTLFSLAPARAVLVRSPEEEEDDCVSLASDTCGWDGAAVPSCSVGWQLPLIPSAGRASPLLPASDGGCMPLRTGEMGEQDQVEEDQASDNTVSIVTSTSGAFASGAFSPCFPIDGWNHASILQSPLVDPLQPVPATEAAAQTVSYAGCDRYADGGASPPLPRSFSYCSALSPETEVVLPRAKKAVQDVPVSVTSENWETKRVRHVSATRRSPDRSLMSPGASVMSFSATLCSSEQEWRSSSASGHERVRHGITNNNNNTQQESATSTFNDAPVPYWTFSPVIQAAASAGTALAPQLPRTLSAPPFQPDSPFHRHTPGFAAADGAGVAVGDPMRRCHKNPAPPFTSEDRQHWCAPPPVRCAESRDTPRASHLSVWLGPYRGRRFAVPQPDSAGELDLPPAH